MKQKRPLVPLAAILIAGFLVGHAGAALASEATGAACLTPTATPTPLVTESPSPTPTPTPTPTPEVSASPTPSPSASPTPLTPCPTAPPAVGGQIAVPPVPATAPTATPSAEPVTYQPQDYPPVDHEQRFTGSLEQGAEPAEGPDTADVATLLAGVGMLGLTIRGLVVLL